MQSRSLPRAIVVGSGAGGAAAARELQGDFQVTILEAGRPFRPLGLSNETISRLRLLGAPLIRQSVPFAFPPMRMRRTPEEMLLVYGRTIGGSTVLSTGNAVRSDEGLRRLGISLDAEFDEITRDIPVTTAHEVGWTPTTRRLHDGCTAMGLVPTTLPKMVDHRRCRRCGRCVLGCPTGAKWDSRRFVEKALSRGATVMPGCQVRSVETHHGKAVAVRARVGFREVRIEADLIVLAAGGLGTPAILLRSGIEVQQRLFVDPVLVVAARLPGGRQQREIPMPFAVQREGYFIAPYFDYLSFLLNRDWSGSAEGIVGLMVKLADTPVGRVAADGVSVEKSLSRDDRDRLAEAQELCRKVLIRCGADPSEVFLGTLNAGHPGGTVPLSRTDAESLHPEALPENLYVADASLFPEPLGAPPILTILALATRVARTAAHRYFR